MINSNIIIILFDVLTATIYHINFFNYLISIINIGHYLLDSLRIYYFFFFNN
jgi:hypothetical protein